MRILLAALLALGAVAAPAALAQPAKDWRLTATAPTGGSFVVGNPAAKVKLVEYLSFTCPHCGHFVLESKAGLHDGFVRNGSVQVETRAAVRDAFDLAAWMVAKCGGPSRFAGVSTAIFAGQKGWMDSGVAYVQANPDKFKTVPKRAQVRLMVDRSGLAAIGAKSGVTSAMLDRCFANDVAMNALVKSAESVFGKISGTPAFEINGTLVADAHDWHVLEPKLRAAGAR